MRSLSFTNLLAFALSLLALGSALGGAYLGTVGALVALTALLTIKVLGGKVELRRWLPSGRLIAEARKGPLVLAEVEVREAAHGSGYFRRQIADALVLAAATRSGLTMKPSRGELAEAQAALLSASEDDGLKEVLAPGPSSHLKGEEYLSRLRHAMDMIEDV
jgi:hypothetical protein